MKSDDELLDALGNITDYTDIAQEAIYLEARERGLLSEQTSSFVLNQIRSRVEHQHPAEPVSIIDVSKLSRLRGIMQFAPRMLILLGITQTLFGIVELPADHYEAIFDLVIGALYLRIALMMYKQEDVTTIGIALLCVLTPIYGLMVLGNLLTYGEFKHAKPLVFFVLGTFSIITAIAAHRYKKEVKNIVPTLQMAFQAKFIQNWKRPSVVVAVFGSFACSVLGALLFLIFVFPQHLARKWAENPDRVIPFSGWEKSLLDLSELQISLMSTLGLALITLGTPFLWYLARRMAIASARELRKHDMRKVILYLRSFGDDRIRLSTRFERVLGVFVPLVRLFIRDVTFEECLVSGLSAYGPVVAISEPGRSLAPIGAAREHALSGEWKERVGDLIRDSAAVIAVLGNTPGLAWELRQLKEMALLHRLLLVVPPVNQKHLFERLEVLSTALPEMTCVPHQKILRSALILLLQASGKPLVISGNGRREANYFEGIRHAIPFVLERKETNVAQKRGT